MSEHAYRRDILYEKYKSGTGKAFKNRSWYHYEAVGEQWLDDELLHSLLNYGWHPWSTNPYEECIHTGSAPHMWVSRMYSAVDLKGKR
jgi:hypothetical protein